MKILCLDYLWGIHEKIYPGYDYLCRLVAVMTVHQVIINLL